MATTSSPLMLIFTLIFAIVAAAAAAADDIQILSAERRVDLTSSIVRVYLTLKVENKGTVEASEVVLAFPPAEAQRLATVKATVVEGKRKKKTYVPLTVIPQESSNAPNGAKLFSVALHNPLKAGESTGFEVLYVLTHSLDPYPAEIGQSEPQLVYYRDSTVLLSPYHVVEQTTFIRLPSKRVESYTVVDPTAHAGFELKYGPYRSTAPYSYSPIIVHFENNNAFAVVEELVRNIEVSHWGNVQVTEHYTLKHDGARHKGVFSRLEYQSRPTVSGAASFKHLLARLPPRVHSVYYRDDIGNISSSHLRVGSQKSELEIEPRYPLFGGWKASFIIGYGLPLEDFLFETTNGHRYLNFSFGCPLAETVVDDLTIKVILPEGSQKPSIDVPFVVEEQLETTYSYLDVVGRKTVVIRKKNVVPEHNVPFQVHYDFNQIFMLAEPLMLVTAVFLFFVACIAYLHIDLSIAKSA